MAGVVEAFDKAGPGPLIANPNCHKAMNTETIRDNAKNGFDTTVDQFENAAEAAQDAFANGREKLQELQENAVKYAKQGAETADRYVRDNPWQAVGIAAAVGLVAGLLIRRR